MKNKQAKKMIESISDPVDLYGVVMLDLPWIKHPMGYMYDDYCRSRDDKIINKALKIANLDAIETIKYFLDERETMWGFNITDYRGSGADYDESLCCYIEQSGPGMCGDDYTGEIWIPITKKRFLTFNYAT